MSEEARCQLCGEPMPKGEEMFNYHGYSGPCPVPMKRFPEWSPERLKELADAEPGGLMACSPELLAELKEVAKTDPEVRAVLVFAGVKLEP